MNHGLAIWESMASRAELVEKYGSLWPAMRRRFRVEGSRAGNSRLVTQTTAKRYKGEYGGKIVEVVPLVSLAERQAKDLPGCEFCKAAAGEPCKSKTGKLRVPHAGRWA